MTENTRHRGLVHIGRTLAFGRPSEVIITVLSLNVLFTLMSGRYSIPLFGMNMTGPSLTGSVVALALWVGLRHVGAHSETKRRLVAWTEVYAPELLVGALLVAGLAVRLWGIRFGDPLVVHPDEHQVVGVAIQMLQRGTFAPNHVYPPAFMYLLMPVFAVYYVWGIGEGYWQDFDSINTLTFRFYVVGRAVNALLGTLTILLVYLLARKLWPGRAGRWVGALAALFVTFSFNHVKESHHAVTDVPVTFVIVLAFMAIVAMYQRGRLTDYLGAGFLCGLACATKYSALPVVLIFGLAHLMARTPRQWVGLKAAVGLAAIPLGFLTAYPYALLQWEPFLDKLGWHAGFSAATFDPADRFRYLIGYSMESGMGLLFTLALGGALVYYVHRRRAEELLLVALITALAVSLTHSSFRFFPRYLLPIIPFAALLVGRLLVEVTALTRERFGGRWRQSLAPAVCGLVTVALVWPQAVETIEFDRLMALDDTRAQAYRLIIERFEPGTRVASEVREIIRLPPGYGLERWSPLHSRRLRAFDAAGIDLAIFSSAYEPDPGDVSSIQARRRLTNGLVLLKEFAPREGATFGPTVRLYARAANRLDRLRDNPSAAK